MSRERIQFKTVDDLARACIDFERRCQANGLQHKSDTWHVECRLYDEGSVGTVHSIEFILEHG